jgi:hypothetical protein
MKPINSRNATHSGAASDSTSSKVHHRESSLVTVQIKLVSPPRHATVLCLFCLIGEIVSPFLLPHLTPGVNRCSANALNLGGTYGFFGLPPSSFDANNQTLQQASAHPLSSGWDRRRCDCSNTPAQSFIGYDFIYELN